MRRFVAGLAVAGIALMMIGMGVLTVRRGEVTPMDVAKAYAASVDVRLIGDTLSFISGAAQDTAFKSGYDCCQFMASDLADTTRPLNVFGARAVILKVMACDTCMNVAVHATAIQFSDDSVYWQSTTIQGIDASFDVFCDTTFLSLGAVATAQTRIYGGGQGGLRITAANPVLANTIFGDPVIQQKWLRIILATTANAVAVPGLSPSQYTVRAYVIRDDVGDEMQYLHTGR